MKETEDGLLNEIAEHQTAEPGIEYMRRREAHLAEAARQMQRFRKVGVVRLASLAAGLALLWLVFDGLAFWWLLPPATVFLVLAEVQARISRARRRCERAAALYDEGLARLNNRWAEIGRAHV